MYSSIKKLLKIDKNGKVGAVILCFYDKSVFREILLSQGFTKNKKGC